jgi:hypothetical protein
MGRLLRFRRRDEAPDLEHGPVAEQPAPTQPPDRSERARTDHRTHVLVPDCAEGDDVYGRGYVFKDMGPECSPPATLLARVAGVTVEDRPEVLQEECFAPLQPVLLSLQFDNPHDSNAVAVMDPSGDHQVGYVEREVAAVVADLYRRKGIELGALVLFEWRRRADDSRCGIRLLLAPVGELHLRIEEEDTNGSD